MPAFRHRVAHFLLKKAGMFDRRYSETLYGERFVIPIINGRKTYRSEDWMAEIIKKLLARTPGTFVDVGVNLGQTMLKVAAADRTREYLGFEPNVACADYANALRTANKLNCTIIPAGLGKETTILMLQKYRDEETDPSASLVEGYRENKVHESQPAMVIGWTDLPDSVAPKDVAIVKIDVEGGEAEVLEGIEAMLSQKRPYILVEILPAYSAENQLRMERQKRIEQVFARTDYTMLRIRRDREEQLAGIEPIDGLGIHGDLALCDYIMVPREKVDEILGLFSD